MSSSAQKLLVVICLAWLACSVYLFVSIVRFLRDPVTYIEDVRKKNSA